MITGTVTDEGLPVVMLVVAQQTWPAIVDTGFSGDRELPAALRAFVNPRFVRPMISVLAGGQSVVEDVYSVDFPFDGQVVMAEATFVPGGDILLGTHLLADYRLEINFAARTVLLERVVP